MNSEQKKNCEILRSMDSKEAADWLLDEYRPKGLCFYVDKRTWSKNEQDRLARYFLASIPHASEHCYKALLSIMSVSKFVNVVIEVVHKMDKADYDLINYYLVESVKAACKSAKDKTALQSLIRVLEYETRI